MQQKEKPALPVLADRRERAQGKYGHAEFP
jgi:hypothetical protein